MPMPTQRFAAALPLLVCATLMSASAQAPTPHKVVPFVPDGLRSVIVDPTTAPAMAAVRDRGVNFANPHSLFPTFTTANASAMAIGHYLGDTGDFSNTIYTGFPLEAAGGSVTPFLHSSRSSGLVLMRPDFLAARSDCPAQRHSSELLASHDTGPVARLALHEGGQRVR
jgi:hypothetical protein